MLVLGIDTSCDDTSASVVEDGKKILSNIVSNQSEIHAKYGGIVPELASRRHIEMIQPVVDEALRAAGAQLSDISAVAVCHGPGLIGSLLIGCSFAKALCYSRGIPLVAVNHLEGHILSVFLETPSPKFPFLSLVVSGGHTSLYLARDYGLYNELGRTRDDAAGEAYDKVSKLLGLGYPGGPVIDKLARQGDPRTIDFPRAYLPETLDFSFSGMKTAVLNFMRSCAAGRDTRFDAGDVKLVENISASFQAAVIDVLVRKTEWAIRKKRVGNVTLSGGVAANSALRERIKKMAEERGVEVFVPPPALCTDNAAMIAVAGYHRFLKGEIAGLDLNPKAYLPLG
ncbi:tRNA N6-adenosine threonylcarbamoyltransferase [Candidatus Sulfobium mesophilum]|uniref:tRNA N6-adenosine threonylcarbamoyltransferase n=1 Tax=Candidatus Sulfobium mesophilum TaxID=2016548 RepID=A0A2U3QJP6_9BACT|nr:tRNA N6-adenosine threonylcarbamoyltransferase [Candidatus Sulfobium mesophilum]